MRTRDRGQDDTRPALLHPGRNRPHVEGAHCEAALDRIGHELRHEIVEVRLEQHDVGLGYGVYAVTEERAHDVRTLRPVRGAGTVADTFERHRRQHAPAVGEGRGEGGAGRGDELRLEVDAEERRADEQRRSRRRGQRQHAVIGANDAPAHGER